MSRIEELIAEHCPHGVPHLALGDVASYSDTRINADNLDPTNFVGVDNLLSNKGGKIDASYLPNMPRLTGYEVDDVLLGNIRPYLKKVWLANDAGGCSGDVLAIRISAAYQGVIDPKFLYFLLSSDGFFAYNMQHARGAKMPRGNKEAILNYSVPVPPLKVQREIVRILDQFTHLEAELEARRHQYEHYWNSLLTPRDGWHRRMLGDVAVIFDGPHATPKKTESGPWYLSISSLKNGVFDLSASAHIGDDQYLEWTRRVAPRLGDTMFSYETRVGQAAYWDCAEPAALGRRMGLLRPKDSEIIPKFMMLAYLGPEFQALIRSKTVRGSTVDRFPIANMATWQISLPSHSEQERIVGLLDEFNTLNNDLSVGLPAELNARRKQYEHYRDRLLTFEEAAA